MEAPYVPTSAETVTADWLKKVVAREWKQQSSNVIITHMHVSPGALRTEGFLSRLQRIFVKAKLNDAGENGGQGDHGDAEETEFHVVAKLYPPGEVHRKIVRNMRAFEREIHVYGPYQEIVMSHQQVLVETDAGGSGDKIHLPIPKCYFYETGIDASCIVLEDLKHTGFRMNDKRIGMTFQHAKLCVEAEAIFAALGANAKMQMGLEDYLIQNAPLLLEPFSEQFGMMMDFQIFPGNIAFARGQNREDLAVRLQEFAQRVGSPFRRLLAGVQRRGQWASFSHGDCWNNNYMFRFEKDADGKEVPVEVKILDLQISRYSHPTADLAAFLLCNLEGEVRDASLGALLRIYYETYASTLDRLKTPTWSRDSYSFDDFMRDMDEAWEYGFLLACWLVPMILSNDEDIPDFDALKDDEKLFDEFFDGHEEKMAKGVNDNVTRRFTNLLDFGVNRGII